MSLVTGGLVIKRLWVQFPAVLPPRHVCEQVVHTHEPLSPSSRLVVLESGLGLESGLKSIFAGLGLGLGL